METKFDVSGIGEKHFLSYFYALGFTPFCVTNSAMAFQVEEKPDVTYSDVGGCKEQIAKLQEVVETPLLHVSIIFSVMVYCMNCM